MANPESEFGSIRWNRVLWAVVALFAAPWVIFIFMKDVETAYHVICRGCGF